MDMFEDVWNLLIGADDNKISVKKDANDLDLMGNRQSTSNNDNQFKSYRQTHTKLYLIEMLRKISVRVDSPAYLVWLRVALIGNFR